MAQGPRQRKRSQFLKLRAISDLDGCRCDVSLTPTSRRSQHGLVTFAECQFQSSKIRLRARLGAWRARGRSRLLPLHPVFFRRCVDPHQRRPAVKPDQTVLALGLLAGRHVQDVGSVMGSKQRVTRKTFAERRRIEERIKARGYDLHLVSPIVNWRAQWSGVTKACVLRHLTHS